MFSGWRYSHRPQCNMKMLASRTDKSVNVCGALMDEGRTSPMAARRRSAPGGKAAPTAETVRAAAAVK